MTITTKKHPKCYQILAEFDVLGKKGTVAQVYDFWPTKAEMAGFMENLGYAKERLMLEEGLENSN